MLKTPKIHTSVHVTHVTTSPCCQWILISWVYIADAFSRAEKVLAPENGTQLFVEVEAGQGLIGGINYTGLIFLQIIYWDME